MLSRRHIRIKVLQALYAFSNNEERDLIKGEKRLRNSIQEIYTLYLYELRALMEINWYANELLEIKKQKKLPTQADLNPNRKFAENKFFKWLEGHEQLNKLWSDHNVRFGDDKEVLRKIFKRFSEEDEQFQLYLEMPGDDMHADKKLVKHIYGTYLTQSETLHQIYEEKSMHWADDLDAAQMMVTKTIKRFDAQSNETSRLPELLKDQEDMDFALKLYRKVIQEDEYYENKIRDKAQNWDTERIAVVDIILMKMAMAELVTFQQIPVKVTLNEYIELSKEYSTVKSGHFINGILDKIKDEMQTDGSIRKIGRGLL